MKKGDKMDLSPKSPKTTIKVSILKHKDNVKELASILKSLNTHKDVPMEEKIELVLLIFSTAKQPKFDLIPYVWNFMRQLYNDMVSQNVK